MISTREITVTKPFLQLPVRYDAPLGLLRITVDGKREIKLGIKLADGNPDYMVFADLSEYREKTIQISYEREQKADIEKLLLSDTDLDAKDLYHERYRQQFHFSSRRGFINDPNGLVFANGEYHLFYQHQPFGTDIGFDLKTWGHAISRDLIHWKELPTALHPDQLGAIYSGSAVVDWDNTAGLQRGNNPTLVFFYTVDGRGADDELPFTQCLAFSNDFGRTIRKYAGNPIIGHEIGMNRDPRVIWHEPSEAWRMVLFLDSHTYGIYGSTNMTEWEKLSEIEIADSQDCPDLFELPVDGDPNNTKWVLWGANSGYLIGGFNGTKFIPEGERLQQQPAGTSYAAQTWSNIPGSDGRVLQIAWFLTETPGMPFTHCMTVPYSLSLKTTSSGIRLCVNPVRELETLRRDLRSWSDISLDPETFPEFNSRKHQAPAKFGDYARYPLGSVGDCLDIECEFAVDSAESVIISIRGVSVVYSTASKSLSLSKRRGSMRSGDEAHLEPQNGVISLRILLDRVSLEVFSADGSVAIPSAVLPVDDDHSLSVASKGGRATLRSLKCWNLSSIW